MIEGEKRGLNEKVQTQMDSLLSKAVAERAKTQETLTIRENEIREKNAEIVDKTK